MIFLAFLFPLGIYLLVLACFHRNQHPVMVSGRWDFAGILFAGSGFILLGGPAILEGFYERWRLTGALGRMGFFTILFENWYFWAGTWLFYFIIIVAISVIALRRRANQTSIYNIEPAKLDELIPESLSRLGIDWHELRPRAFLLKVPALGKDFALASSQESELSEAPPASDRKTIHSPSGAPISLELEPFAQLRHVTLRWSVGDHWLRTDVEAELGRILEQVHTQNNPVGGWLMTISSSIFMITFGILCFALAVRIIQYFR